MSIMSIDTLAIQLKNNIFTDEQITELYGEKVLERVKKYLQETYYLHPYGNT